MFVLARPAWRARLRASAALSTALAALVLGAGPAAGPARAGGLPEDGVPLPQLLREAPALAPAPAPIATLGPADSQPQAFAAPPVAGPLQPELVTTTTTTATATTAAPRRARAARSWVPGSIVQVRSGQEAVVHKSPDGPVVEVFGDSSDQGGRARAFTVYRVAPGGWLGVSVAALQGRLGWIRADASTLVAKPAQYEIRVSLHRRTLTLFNRGRRVFKTLIVIGAAGTPTPAGHFTVDDKVRFAHADPAYGAGVLALSVPPPHRDWHQWRVAIHGMNNLGTLGGTGSLGCVHVPGAQLNRLLSQVPVGTPVDVA